MNNISQSLSAVLGTSPQSQWLLSHPEVLALIVAWSLAWKGVAMWKAARLSQKWWFIIIFILNTLGIVEIIYLFVIARKYTVESSPSDQ